MKVMFDGCFGLGCILLFLKVGRGENNLLRAVEKYGCRFSYDTEVLKMLQDERGGIRRVVINHMPSSGGPSLNSLMSLRFKSGIGMDRSGYRWRSIAAKSSVGSTLAAWKSWQRSLLTMTWKTLRAS